MKLKLTLGLLAAALGTTAFAQTDAPAEKKPEDAPAEKKVTFSGILQGKAHLVDSQRGTTPDFELTIPQLNVGVSEGIAKGAIDLRFTGNNTEDDKKNQRVLIRRAEAGLDLPFGTGIRVGRTRPGNPSAWGADITTTLDGYGFIDGLKLSHKAGLGEGNSVTAAVTLGNNLSVPGAAKAKSNVFDDGGSSFKKEKATVASVMLEVSGVKAGVFYGTEKNQIILNDTAKTEFDGLDADGKAKEKKTLAKLAVANSTHIEASLGYDKDGIGAGIAYQQISKTKPSLATIDGGGRVTKIAGKVGKDDAPEDSKSTEKIISLGLNGDSTFFGLQDFAQKGDKLTYGLSYAITSARTGGVKESDNDVTQIGASIGYGVGAYVIELNADIKSTKAKTFADKKGVGPSPTDSTLGKKSATRAYINSIYVF